MFAAQLLPPQRSQPKPLLVTVASQHHPFLRLIAWSVASTPFHNAPCARYVTDQKRSPTGREIGAERWGYPQKYHPYMGPTTKH